MLDITRSMPAPASLARAVSYKDEDVLRALHRDFRGKCYLCESPVPLGGYHVDHRILQSTSKADKFSWSNLFPACNYCNERRPKKCPPEGLASPGEGIERRIEQEGVIDTDLQFACRFAASDATDAPAINTAQELQWIHSVDTGTNPAVRLRARSFLDTIHDHYNAEIWPSEVRVRRGRARGEPDLDAEDALRRVLSRRAPYTMLMRSLVDPALSDLFD